MVINMDTVARLLHERGMSARVEQTGGGVATLYANLLGSYREEVVVGPGAYDDGGVALADTEDLGIGRGDRGWHVPENVDEEDVARLVAAQASSTRYLTDREVDALLGRLYDIDPWASVTD